MRCLTLYCFLLPLALSVRPPEDICHYHGGRRFYVELGDSGTLTAANVTSPPGGWPTAVSAGRGPGPPPRSNLTSHQQCTVELVTCPSCVFRVVFRSLDLSRQCGGGNQLMDSPCRCDYVWVSEPPYDEHADQQFCGIANDIKSDDATFTYESKTRTLSISLVYSEAHRRAFTLEFTAKSNRQIISGSPVGSSSSIGSLTSPFFPSLYPRDLTGEFLLTCSQADCRVRIIFIDYQIATVSFIEFIDVTTQSVEIASGASFRPSVYISSGPALLIRFYANGGSGPGFKAVYSFITGTFAETAVRPTTDCGGFVEDFGGAITMMNMVLDGVRSYDCIWLIRPPENFLHLKTHLSLKVATFLDFAGSTELQIRQGLTSEDPTLETLRHPISQLHFQRAREHIVPVTSGFYVRLQGTFNADSRLAITYSAFSYNKCFPGSEFLCANHRCIPGKLSCDSFDNCGDNSDEPASCHQEWATEFGDRQWYSQTPNYFFPKTDRYADLKTATVIFLVSSLGLIILITALIVLLYRMNSRARQQRELQSHLQTISELLDNARMEDIVPDEPPRYEPPPDYEEILKTAGTPTSTTRRKRRVSRHGSRRSRSSPGERRRASHGTVMPILEVALPAERRRRSRQHLTPTRALARHPSNASADSVGGRSTQSQTLLPDSPPPPYSPTNNQTFVFTSAPASMLQTTGPETDSASQPLVDIPAPALSWCVTAILNNPSPTMASQDLVAASADVDPRRRLHQRSMSCVDHREYEQLIRKRQTQSNPLTPLASPQPERGPTSIASLSPSQSQQSTPNTDSHFYVFSSLESEDLNPNYIRSRDFFDWDEFDRQFPGRKTNLMKGNKVAEMLKKYDELVFVNNGDGCACEGACSCATFNNNNQKSNRENETNVWEKSYILDMSQE